MTCMPFNIVIPARYGSQRLPGKPLMKLAGATLLEHVYRRASNTTAETIVIATDDKRIADHASGFAEHICMTSSQHTTGTDRIVEVVQKYAWGDDQIVVNLQGDEPLMPVALIEKVAHNLGSNSAASIATLSTPITTASDVEDTHKVKVVVDRNNMALYFSRAMIPWVRDQTLETPNSYARHIGLYAYRVHFLRAFRSLVVCELETLEKLEQLRALWHGYKIHVDCVAEAGGGDVNTLNDLFLVEQQLIRMGLNV